MAKIDKLKDKFEKIMKKVEAKDVELMGTKELEKLVSDLLRLQEDSYNLKTDSRADVNNVSLEVLTQIFEEVTALTEQMERPLSMLNDELTVKSDKMEELDEQVKQKKIVIDTLTRKMDIYSAMLDNDAKELNKATLTDEAREVIMSEQNIETNRLKELTDLRESHIAVCRELNNNYIELRDGLKEKPQVKLEEPEIETEWVKEEAPILPETVESQEFTMNDPTEEVAVPEVGEVPAEENLESPVDDLVTPQDFEFNQEDNSVTPGFDWDGMFANVEVPVVEPTPVEEPTDNVVEPLPVEEPTDNVVEPLPVEESTDNVVEPTPVEEPTDNVVEPLLVEEPTDNVVENKEIAPEEEVLDIEPAETGMDVTLDEPVLENPVENVENIINDSFWNPDFDISSVQVPDVQAVETPVEPEQLVVPIEEPTDNVVETAPLNAEAEKVDNDLVDFDWQAAFDGLSEDNNITL